jgi:hypothetical protein
MMVAGCGEAVHTRATACAGPVATLNPLSLLTRLTGSGGQAPAASPQPADNIEDNSGK